MRISMLLVTLSLSLTGAALGQVSSAINARIRSDMDRMRGERVSVTDETMKPGRDLDLVKIQKKDAELTELLNSVNIDLRNLQQGVRSADRPKKLQQLEKLAKELRQSVE
jgi:3,4-dihydroxy-2-butanone 4-phosphate synthase